MTLMREGPQSQFFFRQPPELRQPMRLQEGLLVDDTFDSVGIVRNNLLPPGASNLRMTALYYFE